MFSTSIGIILGQGLLIGLFVGLLYVIEVGIRRSRALEENRKKEIVALRELRSLAFQKSVEHLRTLESDKRNDQDFSWTDGNQNVRVNVLSMASRGDNLTQKLPQ